MEERLRSLRASGIAPTRAVTTTGAAILGISLFAVPASRAAESPQVVPPAPATAPSASPLTLPEALALAARHNELAGIAQARVDRARALRREAYATLWPEVNVSGTFTRRSEEVTRTIDDEEVVVQALNA